MNIINNPPYVFIVVLNWNGWLDTIECINSLRRITYNNFRIVICDNNSSDESLDRIREWACLNGVRIVSDMVYSKFEFMQNNNFEMGPGCDEEDESSDLPVHNNIIIIKNIENSGFAGGNNIAIRYALNAGAQYILILNNDVVVAPDFLTEMVKAAIDEKADMVAPVITDYNTPDVIDRIGITLTRTGLGYDRKHKTDGPFFCPSGCAALYSRELLKSIECKGEYFDEDFFAYCEDLDLGFRARLNGFNAAVAMNAAVRHKGGRAFGGTRSEKQYYLRHRNTIWLIVKNYSISFLLRSLPFIILIQLLGLIKNIGGKFSMPVLKGKIDGIKGIGKMLEKRRIIQKKTNITVKNLLNKKLFIRTYLKIDTEAKER